MTRNNNQQTESGHNPSIAEQASKLKITRRGRIVLAVGAALTTGAVLANGGATATVEAIEDTVVVLDGTKSAENKAINESRVSDVGFILNANADVYDNTSVRQNDMDAKVSDALGKSKRVVNHVLIHEEPNGAKEYGLKIDNDGDLSDSNVVWTNENNVTTTNGLLPDALYDGAIKIKVVDGQAVESATSTVIPQVGNSELQMASPVEK